MFKPLILPAERGDSWAIMGIGLSKKSQKGHSLFQEPKFSVVNAVILKTFLGVDSEIFPIESRFHVALEY